MNGQKYGHNYAPKAHGFNRRARLFPVGYYAPRRPLRLNEVMWDRLMARMPRVQCGGTPDEMWSQDGLRVRPIKWGKTLGWWTAVPRGTESF